MADPVDPNELVTGPLTPNDSNARRRHPKPVREQPTHSIVRTAVERRRHYAYYNNAVAHRDDLVAA